MRCFTRACQSCEPARRRDSKTLHRYDQSFAMSADCKCKCAAKTIQLDKYPTSFFVLGMLAGVRVSCVVHMLQGKFRIFYYFTAPYAQHGCQCGCFWYNLSTERVDRSTPDARRKKKPPPGVGRGSGTRSLGRSRHRKPLVMALIVGVVCVPAEVPAPDGSLCGSQKAQMQRPSSRARKTPCTR